MPIYKLHDSAGTPLNDPMLAIAMGAVDGVFHINKFGENEDVANDVAEDIWTGSTPYPYPTTATITHVNQEVDQVAMRGGRINISGLDADWNVKNQFVILDASNSSTPVALGTPLIRVHRSTVGSPVQIDSVVSIHNAADDEEYARLEVGHNQTMMAQYTIPIGHRGYIVSYYGSVVSDSFSNKEPTYTEFHLYARAISNNHDWQIKHEIAIPINGPGFQHFFKPYYELPDKTDIRLNVLCKAEPGHVHGGFDLIIVDEKYL